MYSHFASLHYMWHCKKITVSPLSHFHCNFSLLRPSRFFISHRHYLPTIMHSHITFKILWKMVFLVPSSQLVQRSRPRTEKAHDLTVAIQTVLVEGILKRRLAEEPCFPVCSPEPTVHGFSFLIIPLQHLSGS